MPDLSRSGPLQAQNCVRAASSLEPQLSDQLHSRKTNPQKLNLKLSGCLITNTNEMGEFFLKYYMQLSLALQVNIEEMTCCCPVTTR